MGVRYIVGESPQISRFSSGRHELLALRILFTPIILDLLPYLGGLQSRPKLIQGKSKPKKIPNKNAESKYVGDSSHQPSAHLLKLQIAFGVTILNQL